ncbi:chorismate mutase [Maribellus mangrovi]|uniref:chorismate mutase n=1 Tax=Maribellus mangrovi TaxID=3133146 RepID=UPI0030EC3A0A
MMNLKNPNQCNSLEELRIEIDKIDHQVVRLLAERLKYVEAVVDFKNDEEGVIAAERKDFVIRQRGEWAQENGLDPITIKQMYTVLIDRNIQHELELLNNKIKQTGTESK